MMRVDRHRVACAAGAAGEAELRKRHALPPALVRYAVRRGVGSMPPFNPTEITDSELDALAEWLPASAAK